MLKKLLKTGWRLLAVDYIHTGQRHANRDEAMSALKQEGSAVWHQYEKPFNICADIPTGRAFVRFDSETPVHVTDKNN